jgi:hypothetical protein
MGKPAVLTKTLAVLGTLLVWFPIAATIVTAVVGSLQDRTLRLDYLMPAELFLAALIGGGALLWAALRARARRAPIAWGLGILIGALFGGQALAVVTGLASGEIEPSGWPWALVMASLALYTLALIGVGAAGAWLIRDVFSPGKPGSAASKLGAEQGH